MDLSTPIVFQCATCRRVVSDSNQLLAAVGELDALVFDSVAGVRIGLAVTDNFRTLSCGACGHLLGRCYAPVPGTLDVVAHHEGAPRYTLHTASLESYVIGTCAGLAPAPAGGEGGEGTATEQLALAGPAAADEGTRLQITQLMRVVLSLDQRLKLIEASNSLGNGAAKAKSPKKRAR